MFCEELQAVGAAIGRPPVEICSDVKQNANAEEITYNITGRDTAIATLAIPNANRLSGKSYFFQVSGAKRMSIGKISSLPRNISKHSTALLRRLSRETPMVKVFESMP